jgi:hypothetical protein
MRRFITGGLIAAIMEATSESANAAYAIKLKNGNEYVTARYWQEGSQVLFETYDGVFGVEKAFVIAVVKSDKTVVTDTDHPSMSRAAESRTGDAGSKRSSQNETPAGQNKPAAKPGPDDPVVGEFNRLQSRAKEVKGMLTSEIRDLLRQIKSFKNKISADSNLFVKYAREFNDVHEISSEVEAALQSRQ